MSDDARFSDGARFDYEQSDIDSTAIGYIAAGLGAVVVAVPLLMPLVFPQSMRHVSSSAPPALNSAAPPLETAPRARLEAVRRGDDHFSGTYGWTDRDHGIVRIPVARAIELLVHRGLPGWPSQ
jgi:hypothetical protein